MYRYEPNFKCENINMKQDFPITFRKKKIIKNESERERKGKRGKDK